MRKFRNAGKFCKAPLTIPFYYDRIKLSREFYCNRTKGAKNMKLFDSEMKVMELLWKNGELTAKELAERLAVEPGWSKTTTYTVLKKCVDKRRGATTYG